MHVIASAIRLSTDNSADLDVDATYLRQHYLRMLLNHEKTSSASRSPSSASIRPSTSSTSASSTSLAETGGDFSIPLLEHDGRYQSARSYDLKISHLNALDQKPIHRLVVQAYKTTQMDVLTYDVNLWRCAWRHALQSINGQVEQSEPLQEEPQQPCDMRHQQASEDTHQLFASHVQRVMADQRAQLESGRSSIAAADEVTLQIRRIMRSLQNDEIATEAKLSDHSNDKAHLEVSLAELSSKLSDRLVKVECALGEAIATKTVAIRDLRGRLERLRCCTKAWGEALVPLEAEKAFRVEKQRELKRRARKSLDEWLGLLQEQQTYLDKLYENHSSRND